MAAHGSHIPAQLAVITTDVSTLLVQLAAIALLVGGMLILAWAFRGSRRPAARPVDPASFPWDQPAADSVRTGAPPATLAERDALMEVVAEIDARADRLEQLIATADDRIRRLERLERAGPGLAPRTETLNDRVYELADQGLPAVEIARQLQQHTGKVELILALRERVREPGRPYAAPLTDTPRR